MPEGMQLDGRGKRGFLQIGSVSWKSRMLKKLFSSKIKWELKNYLEDFSLKNCWGIQNQLPSTYGCPSIERTL